MKFRWKKNNEDMPVESSRSIEVLAPRLLNDNDSAYHCVEELKLAMHHPDCLNIALTGGFGSGKSSVLKTFIQEDGAKYNYLKISLSNFVDEETKIDDNYENTIESKIFQHILYKANYDKTAKTNYHRINFIPTKTAIKKAIAILLFFLSYIIVFEPECFRVDAIYDVYFKVLGEAIAYWFNVVFDILSCLYMFLATGHVIGVLCRRFKPISIKSIKATEFTLDFKSEKSAFKELLGEILYFFKAGDYNLIIFEDLDRIKNPKNLFLKFREVNQLLNESDDFRRENRKIRFIYAIRDDVFTDEVRTKCFDYLIPVIPVVNSFNAGEYLLANYADELKNISTVDVKRLGAYISTMRELTNIMNEFMLYSRILLVGSMSPKKLLAITIYKNLYPTDYSLTHQKEGCLYTAFANKNIFTEPLVKEKKESIIRCNDTIKKERESITKCRETVLNWLQTHDNITDLVINGIAYSLSDIAKADSLFAKFRNDKVERWISNIDPDSETGTYNYHFKDILSQTDPDQMFDETIYGHESTISHCSEEKGAMEKQIFNIEGKTLRELMLLNGDGTISKPLLIESLKEVKCEEKDRLIDTLHAMILSGYITDDYTTYISYTHKGSFSEQEFKFQQSVIQGIPLEYGYKLNHIDAFIDNLYTDNYESKSILNFDLLNYLLKGGRAANLDSFIATARKNLDFVVKYDQTQKNDNKFLTYLFKGWQGCVDIISGIQDNDIRTYMLHLLYRCASTEFGMSASESEFVGTQYKFIADDITNCSLPNLKKFFSHHDIVFKELAEPTDTTKPLFESVVAAKRFEISYVNLRIIYGPDFDSKSLTTIQNGNEKTQMYVTRDINHLVGLFTNFDNEEDESAMLSLSKYTSITDEKLVTFCKRQKEKISKLSEFDKSRYPALMEADVVVPNWKNVRTAFNNITDADVVTDYVEKYAAELSVGSMIDGDSKLQNILLNDNETLSAEAYKLIASCAHYYVNVADIEGLEEKRVGALLENGLLQYKTVTTDFISKYSPHIIAEYIIRNFDEIQADENPVQFTNSNALGIEIMRSSLSIEQKRYFLKEFGSIITVEGHDEGAAEYSQLVCEFYHDNGIDKDNTDFDFVTKALENYQQDDSWQTRIELINMVHQSTDYVSSRTNRMVTALGIPYVELLSYSNKTFLDDNTQNNQLVDYLKDNQPYIYHKFHDNGQLKITYHRGNKEE